jgi:hypothetical protein
MKKVITRGYVNAQETINVNRRVEKSITILLNDMASHLWDVDGFEDLDETGQEWLRNQTVECIDRILNY